jgi:hypothetical protein
MSYPGSDLTNPLNGEGALAVGGIGGAIIMGAHGLITQVNVLGNNAGIVIFGETDGPNSVNPSGTPSGITLATQNNFRSGRSRRR